MNYRKGLLRVYVVWFIIWTLLFWLGRTREGNGWIMLTDPQYASIRVEGADAMHNGELLQIVAICMVIVLPVALLMIIFLADR